MVLLDSDAGRWAILAGLAVAVAILAWIGDRRRMRRRDPDRVGWVPWTALFLIALLLAVVALVFATGLWLAPA